MKTPEFDDSVRLGSLRKNMSEMSDDELRAMIGESRNNRRPQPKPPKVKKEKKKKVKPNLLDTNNIEGMTPEMAAMLLKKLQG